MKIIIQIFILSFLLSACGSKEELPVANNVETGPIMPNRVLNAAFLIVDGVYNSELIAPMDILHHTLFGMENSMM